ncbi:hypothetical protein CP8484711_2121A, partial [Chlamydia psittaci 84-8471/1]
MYVGINKTLKSALLLLFLNLHKHKYPLFLNSLFPYLRHENRDLIRQHKLQQL